MNSLLNEGKILDPTLFRDDVLSGRDAKMAGGVTPDFR